MIILSKNRIEIPSRQFQRPVSHFRPTSGGGGGGPPASPITTWNTSIDTGAIVYTNGGLTAATADGGGDHFTMGTQVIGGTDKIYVEAIADQVGGGYEPNFGLTGDNPPLSFSNYTSYFANGGAGTDGGQSISGLGAWSNGDRIGMAVNFPAKLVWWRRNGGNYNADAGANPVTNTGGCDFSPITGTIRLLCGLISGARLTLVPGPTFGNSAPSGYTTVT